jgi:hypothetical protein
LFSPILDTNILIETFLFSTVMSIKIIFTKNLLLCSYICYKF